MALNDKQKRFVAEYLIDLNATQAAIRAGYSAKTAHSQGPRLLEHVEIAAAVDAAKLERSQRTQVDADWLLKRLADEADADLADLYTETGDLKPVEAWPKIWRQGLVAGVEVDALYDGFGENRTQVGLVKKIKLSDRTRRLELIGKHIKVNAFQENVNYTGFESLGDRLDRATARLERALKASA